MDPSTLLGNLISEFVYFGGSAIACVAYLIVGVHLYRLGQRTGQLPEFLFAASFLYWVVSYLIWDIPYAFVGSEELIPAFYSYASLIAVGLGNVSFALFIRLVFRPNARWATWLVAAIAISLVAGVAGSAWIGDWEGINPLANPWYWLEYFGGFAPSCWMGAEGFAQYFKARRRLKLGLSEPMTCNRFLLWGIAGALWATLEVIITANDFAMALTGQWSPLLENGTAFFGIAPVLVVWLIFFPPESYRRWVEGGGKPAEAEPPTVD